MSSEKTRQNFYHTVKEWEDYVLNGVNKNGLPVMLSSNPSDIIACEPFEKIVSMGIEALQFIRELYDNDINGPESYLIRGHGLPSAVKYIMDEKFVIPADVSGNIVQMEEYTRSWLDENMGKL